MDYLLYQTSDGTLKKKEITNKVVAQQIVDKADGKLVTLGGEQVHIVGIGTEEDYKRHQEILKPVVPSGSGYMKFKAGVAYYKEHGKWPD